MSWLGPGLRLGNEEYGAAVDDLIELEVTAWSGDGERY